MLMTNTLYTRAVQAAATITEECARVAPTATLGALRAYLVKGQKPGGFLLAVLENDLMTAACKADSENLAALGCLARAIEKHAPRTAHGDALRVDAWMEAAENYYLGGR